MTTKLKLLQICNDLVDKRINGYKEEISLIKDAIESNDKGNLEEDDIGNSNLLGDLEKNLGYLADAQKNKAQLQLIKPNIVNNEAVLGSIVKTNLIHFYIAVSLGKIDLGDEESYYAISFSSPIGQLLRNKKVNDQFEFNQSKYIIKEIK
ncbi:hypothetical protein [Tamlana flava]|uniref:hypothetical protein n=1 Tax=Tamlana flava TaxID=3158572 RepID=UPI00351B7370